jgi:hypothetical protein
VRHFFVGRIDSFKTCLPASFDEAVCGIFTGKYVREIDSSRLSEINAAASISRRRSAFASNSDIHPSTYVRQLPVLV